MKNESTAERNNRIVEFEHIFSENKKNKRPDKVFIRTLFKQDFWKILLSSILYLIKASPLWVIPLLTSDIIDQVTMQGDGFMTRIWIDGGIMLVLLLQNFPNHILYARITDNMIRETSSLLRSSVIRKLQGLSITYHHQMESGKLQSKFLNDIENVDAYYRQMIQILIPSVIGVLVAVGISLYKSPWVTLFFLVIVPVNILNVLLYRKWMKKTNHDYRLATELMSARLTRFLQMLPIVKSHGLEKDEEGSLDKDINGVKKAGLALDKAVAVYGTITWIISQLLSMGCLFFCVFLCLKDKLSIGNVVLFQSLFSSINGSVLNLINIYPTLVKGRESINSLSELMTEKDMESKGGDVRPKNVDGFIDFDHVYYHYPDSGELVIQDFNLHVDKGECVALVGSSGAGKSTIINLLIGLLSPTKGEVKIDGVDMKELDIERYRHFLSVVPQNSILFAGTIRENITYGLDHYKEEDVEEVCKEAGVDEFLPELPKGLDTQVGEGGNMLSGGQKQRVCIARALIRKPSILILDEATSALDNVSEYHIQNAIDHMMHKRTTFIVAHRLSTIRNADIIIVMEKGQAVEMGDYESLMKLNGKFAQLVRLSEFETEKADK